MTDATPDWSRAFDDPISVPDGRRVLRALHDAGHYVTALPKAVQQRAGWQTAAQMLTGNLTHGFPIASRTSFRNHSLQNIKNRNGIDA